MFRFPHLGAPPVDDSVPHSESQMIHPTQQLSGSALSAFTKCGLLRDGDRFQSGNCGVTALGSCLAALRTVQFVAKRIFKRVTRGRIDRQIDMARLDRRLLFAIDDLVAAFRFALDRNPRNYSQLRVSSFTFFGAASGIGGPTIC